MSDHELETRINSLSISFQKANSEQRVMMQPGIERIIRTLKSQQRPIPKKLRQLEAALREEEDDFFDNMPI